MNNGCSPFDIPQAEKYNYFMNKINTIFDIRNKKPKNEGKNAGEIRVASALLSRRRGRGRQRRRKELNDAKVGGLDWKKTNLKSDSQSTFQYASSENLYRI